MQVLMVTQVPVVQVLHAVGHVGASDVVLVVRVLPSAGDTGSSDTGASTGDLDGPLCAHLYLSVCPLPHSGCCGCPSPSPGLLHPITGTSCPTLLGTRAGGDPAARAGPSSSAPHLTSASRTPHWGHPRNAIPAAVVTHPCSPRYTRSQRKHLIPSTSISRSCGKRPALPARPQRSLEAPYRTGKPTQTRTVDICFIITQ